MTGAIIGLGAATLGSTIAGAYGANQQANAAEAAEEEKIRLATEQMNRAQLAGYDGADVIAESGELGGQALEAYGAQGIGEMMAGRDMAAGQLLGYGDMARNDLMGGYGGAMDTLGGAMAGARGDIAGGLGAAQGYMSPVTGMAGYAHQAAQGINPYDVAGQFAQQSQMGKLMADPSGYMAQDPGYQFRQQQGIEAVNEMASARGGRNSGRTMKELAGFNSGLASQEFGAAAGRAQAADAQTLGALMNQGGRADQAGLAAQGIQAGLGQMGMQGYNTLGGMAYGAGNNMANLGMQGGLGLAGMQQGMGQALAGQASAQGSNLANLYQGSGNALGQAYMGMGNNLAGLFTNIGAGQSNALQNTSAQQAALTQGAMNAAGSSVPYQGGVAGSVGNGINQMGQLAALAMMSGAGGAATDPMAASGYGTGGGTLPAGTNFPS